MQTSAIPAVASFDLTVVTLQVPFRDSMLTKLLADGLLNAATTAMLACLSPCAAQAEQTQATLHFASVASRIRTTPVMRVDPHDKARFCHLCVYCSWAGQWNCSLQQHAQPLSCARARVDSVHTSS